MMPSQSCQSIRILCYNYDDRSESELVEQLKLILSANPDAAHEIDDRDGAGQTLLHRAAGKRSVTFCKLLVEQNTEAVRVTDRCGNLPFHLSCAANNVDTAKYLYQLYPDSIDIPISINGLYAIHVALRYKGSTGNRSELIRFLLKHDRGAVTRPDEHGYLPLHIALLVNSIIDVVRLVFDAYPDVIYTEIVMAREVITTWRFPRYVEGGEEFATFLESQLEFVRQSAEESTPDENGQLTIHRSLQNRDLSLGTIKLMVKANSTIISAADNQGYIPLHIACQIGDFDIAKYLIETNVDSLEVYDLEGNCVLHHACLAGNSDIINCILEKSAHGSSVRNSEGKLPIQSLLYDADINRDSLEYVGAVYGLLSAYPNVQDIALEWMND